MLPAGAARGSPAAAEPAAAVVPAEGAATPIDDAFELLEMLGKGSYGSVYRGRARANGELFAIKVIPLAEGVRVRNACAAAHGRVRRGRHAWSACATCRGAQPARLRLGGLPGVEPSHALTLLHCVPCAGGRLRRDTARD